MANMSARNYSVVEKQAEMEVGGFAESNASRFGGGGKMFNGPSWFADKIQDIY